MSLENVKRFELGIALLCNDGKLIPENKITREIRKKIIEVAILLEETALEHNDTDVLERAFDYFLQEEEDATLANGICETLENDIFRYFTWKQILSVLEKKLEKLIDANLLRATHFAGACISRGYFKQFQRIFNSIHSADRKNILLKECDEWIGEDYPKEIAILREDVKEC